MLSAELVLLYIHVGDVGTRSAILASSSLDGMSHVGISGDNILC